MNFLDFDVEHLHEYFFFVVSRITGATKIKHRYSKETISFRGASFPILGLKLVRTGIDAPLILRKKNQSPLIIIVF